VVEAIEGGGAEQAIRDQSGIEDLCSQLRLSDISEISDIALLGC
jgi:hypothetical protein